MKHVDARLRPHVQLLAEWDGSLPRNSRAGPLYAAWLQELLAGLYRPHVPDVLMEFVASPNQVPVLLEALEEPQTRWFGENPEAARNRLLHESLAKAVARVEEVLSADTSRWAWGRLHTVTFTHPLAVLGKEYAQAFSLDPVGRPGDGLTPNATRHNEKFEQTNGATYRHLFDLADWDRGLATSAPGQSGQPGSPHYADLLPLWAEGRYFPLAYSRQKVEEVTRHRLRLQPLPAGGAD
jgi:penicillin amidase